MIHLDNKFFCNTHCCVQHRSETEVKPAQNMLFPYPVQKTLWKPQVLMTIEATPSTYVDEKIKQEEFHPFLKEWEQQGSPSGCLVFYLKQWYSDGVMVIKSQVRTKYIFTSPRVVTESLHINVGEDFDVQKGDTIILYPKKANKIEIKRKLPIETRVPMYPYPNN